MLSWWPRPRPLERPTVLGWGRALRKPVQRVGLLARHLQVAPPVLVAAEDADRLILDAITMNFDDRVGAMDIKLQCLASACAR
jgi:hypothetical protein